MVQRYSHVDEILATIAITHGVRVSVINLPSFIDDGSSITLKAVQDLKTQTNTPVNIVRWMPFGQFEYIAVTDFLSNVYLFKGGTLIKVYISAHVRIITELVWFFSIDHSINHTNREDDNFKPHPYFVTTSLDGYMKIWSLTDQQTPLYEQYYSQRWVFSAAWDPCVNALVMNFESKFFPQRIFSLQKDQIRFRKLNFYLDNVLATRTSVGRDFVYSCGIDGIVSRVAKRDYCRVIERKHKEKLRNLSVQRVASFMRTAESVLMIQLHDVNAI